jgi:hypothetical protein
MLKLQSSTYPFNRDLAAAWRMSQKTRLTAPYLLSVNYPQTSASAIDEKDLGIAYDRDITEQCHPTIRASHPPPGGV